MLKEFKTFIVRGNMIDLAVGFVLGTAFGKIVTSLVDDILMPPLGLFLGKVNFSNLFINLSGRDYPSLQEAKQAGAATINYGLFINSVVDFLIVGFVFFLFLKQINRLKQHAPPSTKECPYCISVIPLKATRCSQCTSQFTTTPNQRV